MKHCRHYYVAVASDDLKLVRKQHLVNTAQGVRPTLVLLQSTLVDLLCALQARGPCALAIACRREKVACCLQFLHIFLLELFSWLTPCSGRDVLDKLVSGLSQVKDTAIAYLVRRYLLNTHGAGQIFALH